MIQPSLQEETKTQTHHFQFSFILRTFSTERPYSNVLCANMKTSTNHSCIIHSQGKWQKSLNNLEQIHFRDLHMSFQSLSVIDPGEKASSAPQMFLSFQPPRNSISAERRVYVKEFNVPNDKTENYKKFAMRLTTNFKYKQPCICELTYVFSG